MKKIISLLAIFAILFASLFMLTGCGDEENSSKKNEENNAESNTANENNMNGNNTENNANTVGGKVDVRDKSNYYFVVNGKKFTTDSKLKDVATETGLVQDASAAEKDIQKNTYLIGGGYFRDAEKKRTIFSVMPINNTAETIKCSEATVGGFNLDNYYYKDYDGKITVAGGITIGNTADELVSIYGEPTEKDMREDYENLGILYRYKVGLYQYYEFEVDKKDNKITEITWRYFER